ncbi:A disintegrin and metalloproteinase with thrombospondin motifs 7 [Onthophagus taurus]|uniref:A disintegrin and metalloproteinase with thrombospondin motifs 7 n=1 Tax=Onthophagus taurus TaxID=166361 RepID=UPI0039BEBA13
MLSQTVWICFVSTLILVKPHLSAAGFYKGLYTNRIEEAHLAVPKKLSPSGKISHDLRSTHDDGTVHFNVTIGEDEHLLILEPSKQFTSPGLIIERHRREVHLRTIPKKDFVDCHYQGYIYGQPNSRVAISACNGLAGIIHTENGKYFIEPHHHHSRKIQPGHPHVIYKRSASVSHHQHHAKKKRKRRKRKQIQNCGTREPKRMTELEWQKQIGKVRVQERRHKHKPKITFDSVKQHHLKKHKYRKLRNTRSVSKARYVEALLVADTSMIEFHDYEGEKEGVETYLLTIMNMVSSLYSDPSIGNFIKVSVVKIILIEDQQAQPELNVTTNADMTLKNFCKWQKGMNQKGDNHPHHHDVAILVTRKDICARKNVPCNTLGVAHVGGMCDSDKSCSVNEDNGITLAHTITHEMGHNFGMYHDTDKIGCKGKIGRKLHIMTPSFEADTVEVSWSECSRRDVTNFLDKGLGECLKDEPKADNYKYPPLPAGAMYDSEVQCRLQFGDYAVKVCTPPEEICSRLWCQVNGTCTTQLRPAAAGTKCGKHMWCEDLKCVKIMEPPKAIDGGWGDWSPWSECSRTCGAGVAIMQRECDHPKPAAGGKFCVGERRRYKICNANSCPGDQPTFRATQCSSFNNRTHEGRKYSWVPYFDQDEPCELYCSDINDTVIVSWGVALDGTPCNVGRRDICISGICRKVGCDWTVDSDAEEDVCGICQGDGTKCRIINGIYKKQGQGNDYIEILSIPTGSKNIRIEEMDYSENYISIGSVFEDRFFLNGRRHITLPGEYTVAGTQALYERDNELEKIRIPGPIKEPILVYIVFRGKSKNPGVKYQYTLSGYEDPEKHLQYEWQLGDWTQCSVTCGGGKQFRKSICRESLSGPVTSFDDVTSTIVAESFCSRDAQPDTEERSCKDEPCPSHWWVGPWQSCPVTCTNKGVKQYLRRSVMCVDGQEMALADKFCDAGSRPLEYKHCGHLPVCPESFR